MCCLNFLHEECVHVLVLYFKNKATTPFQLLDFRLKVLKETFVNHKRICNLETTPLGKLWVLNKKYRYFKVLFFLISNIKGVTFLQSNWRSSFATLFLLPVFFYRSANGGRTWGTEDVFLFTSVTQGTINMKNMMDCFFKEKKNLQRCNQFGYF